MQLTKLWDLQQMQAEILIIKIDKKSLTFTS